MTINYERLAAIFLIALLGAGVIGMLVGVVWDGKVTAEDGGWILAGFLTIREIISKIEKIALGGTVEISNTEENPVPVDPDYEPPEYKEYK